MKKMSISLLLLSLAVFHPSGVHGQDECGTVESGGEITAIPFESIPAGVDFISGGGSIGLLSDTDVSGSLRTNGEVESGQGFRFPDGSLQNTAAANATGQSGNAGLYSNTIVEFTPGVPFTEVCFKGGLMHEDIHAISESTLGGNCVPGDVGWVIEREEREVSNWHQARLQCLLVGMRLPELFEWLVSCDSANTLGLSDMVGPDSMSEWASNSAFPAQDGGTVAARTGRLSCYDGNWSYVVRPTGVAGENNYRCVR